MRSPHLLIAASNPIRLRENLRGILPADSINLISDEFEKNVKSLHQLGLEHYRFAKRLSPNNWRQKVSRFYYSAYNIVRAIKLFHYGDYNTDVSDHKKITKMPDGFPNKEKYQNQLPSLRDDRNLADYDHTGSKSELLLTLSETTDLVTELIADSKSFFRAKGMAI